MTKKEAIKLIQEIEEDGRNVTTEHIEALNFAIDRLIDNAPTIETSKIEHKAYNEGFKDGVEQGIRLSDRPQGKWYDHVEDSLLKARHGKHVLYDVDYLLDHLAHEVSIMEQVRQMRDKEI